VWNFITEQGKLYGNLQSVKSGTRDETFKWSIASESYKHLQVVQNREKIDIIPTAHLTDEKINAVYALVHSDWWLIYIYQYIFVCINKLTSF